MKRILSDWVHLNDVNSPHGFKELASRSESRVLFTLNLIALQIAG